MAVLRPVLPWTDFTPMRNCWLRDPLLTLKGKGLLGYLLSHAPGYKISRAQIVRENDDGKDSVITAMAELAAGGYLTRVAHRSSGRFAEDDYVITDPFDERGHRMSGKSAPPERANGRETRQSGKSATAEPGQGGNPDGAGNPPIAPRGMSGKAAKADSPLRKIRSGEDKGENTSPIPTGSGGGQAEIDLGLPQDGHANGHAPTINQRTKILADEHFQACEGMENWQAARGVIVAAVKAGKGDEEIRKALAAIRAAHLSLTRPNLRRALDSPDTLPGRYSARPAPRPGSLAAPLPPRDSYTYGDGKF